MQFAGGYLHPRDVATAKLLRLLRPQSRVRNDTGKKAGTADQQKHGPGKVFAPRVEKLIEDLQAVAKTANLEIYEFDDALVKKLFIELARRFRATAHRFGIEFEISVEGESIQ